MTQHASHARTWLATCKIFGEFGTGDAQIFWGAGFLNICSMN